MDALGLAFIAFGVVGLYLKKDRYQIKRSSYTGHPLRWGPYLLLVVGIILFVGGLLDDISQ